MEWITLHWETLLAIAGAIYTLVSLIVGLTPSTKDDAFLRRIAEWLSFLAPSNSGRVLAAPGTRGKSKDDDRDDGVGPTGGALTLGLILFLVACSTGQLQAHATAARLSRATLEGARVGIESACAPARSAEMARGGVSPDDHAKHVARCRKAGAGHELTRQAWLTYVDAVLAAGSGGKVDLVDIIAWAARLARTYTALAEVLVELGLEPPQLPAQLRGRSS